MDRMGRPPKAGPATIRAIIVISTAMQPSFAFPEQSGDSQQQSSHPLSQSEVALITISVE